MFGKKHNEEELRQLYIETHDKLKSSVSYAEGGGLVFSSDFEEVNEEDIRVTNLVTKHGYIPAVVDGKTTIKKRG